MSRIQLYLDWMGRWSENHRDFLVRFGRLESKLLTYDIEDIAVTRPVFVTGLARAGSTVLLETLNVHPDLSSHQYGDYPFPQVNYFWNVARGFFPAPARKAERAHRDGLYVNSQSPEALDEIIWMSFFDDLHSTEGHSCVLDAHTERPDFEDFFDKHLRKLLFLRKGARYLSKNNYNFTRLGYLKALYSDARFVIPLREPLAHIYSLCKQNRLIREAQARDPRALRFMRAHGHFEFGLDFRPVCLGGADDACYARILALWREERFAEAYAHYWNYVYRYLYEAVFSNSRLADSCFFVRYEDLCGSPAVQIDALLDFCGLEPAQAVQDWAAGIRAPDYYAIDFTEAERDMIEAVTKDTYRLFES